MNSIDEELKAAIASALSKNRVLVALDENDQLADFSNFGAWTSVAAPGTAILSTTPEYGVMDYAAYDYDRMDGTSMASPLVAGVAALVLSQNPELSQAAVKARLESSADDLVAPGFDPRFGHGRVDACVP